MITSFNFILLRRGTLYAPQEQGVKDILITGERITLIGEEEINPPEGWNVRVIDASNRLVVPGFIDLHVHLLGGGGEDGPASRVPEIFLPTLTTAGITTAVGVLGMDSITRSPEALLAKVQALCKEGLTAYMYIGAYHLPSPTITGSVARDIALIDEVVGVKIAVSDHRSSQPTVHELARLASEARIGGMLGKKPGLVHTHVGAEKSGLDPLLSAIENTAIPISQFLPTHISRNLALLEQGMEFVKRGGVIDITAPDEPEKALLIIEKLLKHGVDLSKVTFSSDGNGSKPKFDPQGQLIGMETGKVSTLLAAMQKLVRSHTLILPQALSFITANPADRLGLSGRKGYIRPGADADLVLLDVDLRIDKVFARGRLMVDGGQPVVKEASE